MGSKAKGSSSAQLIAYDPFCRMFFILLFFYFDLQGNSASVPSFSRGDNTKANGNINDEQEFEPGLLRSRN